MSPNKKKQLCLHQEILSQRWKLRLFLFNISCCLAAAYFFRRHNKFCEPGSECSSVSLQHSRCFATVISSLYSSTCSLHPLRLIWVPGGLLQYGFPHDSFLGLWEQRGDCGHATRRQTVLMDILWTDTDVNTTPAALCGREHVLLSLNVFFVSYITDWKQF